MTCGPGLNGAGVSFPRRSSQIYYSYAGLGNINNVLNEVKDPVRTLKSVGPLALLTACIMYVLVNVAYFAVVPIEDIKESGELIAALFFQRVFGTGLWECLFAVGYCRVGRWKCHGGDVQLGELPKRMGFRATPLLTLLLQARLNQEVARQGFLPYAEFIGIFTAIQRSLGRLDCALRALAARDRLTSV